MKETQDIKILRTVENQVIKLDIPEGATPIIFDDITSDSKLEEYVLGEFVHYKNCAFDCDINRSVCFYFDECIFENCKFLGRTTNNTSLSFINVKIKNTDINGNYSNIMIATSTLSAVRFDQCAVEAMIFKYNYLIRKVRAFDSNIDMMTLADNLNYSLNDFTKTYINILRFSDNRPLSVYKESKDLMFKDNLDIISYIVNPDEVNNEQEED